MLSSSCSGEGEEGSRSEEGAAAASRALAAAAARAPPAAAAAHNGLAQEEAVLLDGVAGVLEPRLVVVLRGCWGGERAVRAAEGRELLGRSRTERSRPPGPSPWRSGRAGVPGQRQQQATEERRACLAMRSCCCETCKSVCALLLAPLQWPRRQPVCARLATLPGCAEPHRRSQSPFVFGRLSLLTPSSQPALQSHPPALPHHIGHACSTAGEPGAAHRDSASRSHLVAAPGGLPAPWPIPVSASAASRGQPACCSWQLAAVDRRRQSACRCRCPPLPPVLAL